VRQIKDEYLAGGPMDAINSPSSEHLTSADPKSKKPCQRSSGPDNVLWLSEVMASCSGQDDIVTAICQVIGQKPSYLALQTVWPWLQTRIQVPCPCRVTHPTVLVTLCHLYDHHVVDKQNWSFSTLVRWVHEIQNRLAPPNPDGAPVERCAHCGSKLRKKASY